MRSLPSLALALVLIGFQALANPAGAQPLPDGWVMLHREAIAGGPRQTITLPAGTPRSTALRLIAKGGTVSIARITVAYGNGQMHFETRPGNAMILLRDGERTREIDKREESRIVETVMLELDPAVKPGPGAQIEIWGLRPPRPTFKGGETSPVAARGEETQAAPRSARGVSQTPASGTGPTPVSGPAPPQKKYVEVPVFYGTTRQKAGERDKNNRKVVSYNGEQGAGLTLGLSVVTVPIERDPGTIPRPETNLLIISFAFRNEDPNRDFTIAAVEELPADRFIAEMKKQVDVSRRYKGQAFVFVHGYNVSFEDALFRTAQITHDIGFDGPAVTFSWPSRGGTLDYRHDLDSAKASRLGLKQLLETLARDVQVTSVNLVAHSMGNDPVIEVLKEQAEIVASGGRTTDFKLNEIVLAAPDISRTVFEQFAARFARLAQGGVTLYASKNDLAMKASKEAARGIVRAGDVPSEGIVIVPGVDSIDISDASTSFLSFNHSTFADRSHIVMDMQLLFERPSNKRPPDIRFSVFRPEGAQPKQWWRYRR